MSSSSSTRGLSHLSPKGIREQFEKDGYVVLEGALEQEHVARIKASLTLLLEETSTSGGRDWDASGSIVILPDGTDRIQKIQSIGLYAPHIVLDDVYRHKTIRAALGALLLGDGPASKQQQHLDFFGTKFFPMFPGGTSVHWHQDNHYFGTDSSSIISCAIYLDDTTAENGCLRVIPGSHKDGRVMEHSKGKGIWAHGEWVANVEESKAINVPCQAGSVVLFNSLLLHAAHQNSSLDKTRYSLFCHYLPSDLEFCRRGVNFAKGAYRDRYSL